MDHSHFRYLKVKIASSYRGMAACYEPEYLFETIVHPGHLVITLWEDLYTGYFHLFLFFLPVLGSHIDTSS